MHSGPVVVSARRDAQQVRLRFEHAAGGLHTREDADLRGFELIDSAGAAHTVEARITGEEVLLRIPAGLDPAQARYAWAPVPVCNLIDGKGLPATPFRVGIGD